MEQTPAVQWQLGSSDLLFTLLEELGEHQGLPEPGMSIMGCAQPAPGDGCCCPC